MVGTCIAVQRILSCGPQVALRCGEMRNYASLARFTTAFKTRARRVLHLTKYPHVLWGRPPATRPSIASVHYFVNMLGRHKPVGLTHSSGTAYHELPFRNLKLKTSRNDLHKRVGRISQNLPIEGQHGLDIGCAIGGVSFSLQLAGAKMVGVDRDRPSIQVARECESLFKTGAAFIEADFSLETIDDILEVASNPISGEVDFTVWLSSFNWVAKELGISQTKEILLKLSRASKVLIADSAIGGKGQGAMDVLGIRSNHEFSSFVLAQSEYSRVRSIGVDGDWYDREVFLFER